MYMKKPEMKVMRFNNEDVIATSTPRSYLTLHNYFDGTPNNAYINYNGVEYTNGRTLRDKLREDFGNEGGFIDFNGIEQTWFSVIDYGRSSDEHSPDALGPDHLYYPDITEYYDLVQNSTFHFDYYDDLTYHFKTN